MTRKSHAQKLEEARTRLQQAEDRVDNYPREEVPTGYLTAVKAAQIDVERLEALGAIQEELFEDECVGRIKT